MLQVLGGYVTEISSVSDRKCAQLRSCDRQPSQDLRKSIEICPPTPNSGGARDQSPPELGDLGGECISPIK